MLEQATYFFNFNLISCFHSFSLKDYLQILQLILVYVYRYIPIYMRQVIDGSANRQYVILGFGWMRILLFKDDLIIAHCYGS